MMKVTITSVGLSFLLPILYLLNLQMQNIQINSFIEEFVTYCLPSYTETIKNLDKLKLFQLQDLIKTRT